MIHMILPAEDLACEQALGEMEVSVIMNIGEIKNTLKTRLTRTKGMFTGYRGPPKSISDVIDKLLWLLI